jgi:DNA processing protein
MDLADALVQAGVAVLSGGAKGIDTAAHRGALRGKGTTAVIAPASFVTPFPHQNRALFRSIVEQGGAYASLVADGERTTRASFFPRNACLVALAHVVVVVEAGFRSGALNAARWARELGRPLMVVPHAPWRPKGKGCLVELRRGAKLCEGPRDILRELDLILMRPAGLGEIPAQQALPFPAAGEGTELERVRAAVAAGAENVDQVSAATGLGPASVQGQILTLTLSGVLAPDPTGRLVLVSPSRCPNVLNRK